MVIDKIFFILSMIIVFYISVNSIQNFNIKYETLDELIGEYKTGFIEDIIIKNPDLNSNVTHCPQSYLPLVQNFNWPGNFNGCGCKKENGKDYQYYMNTCPMLKECKKVEESDKIIFDKWRGNLICYKRSNLTYEHFDLLEYKDIDKCDNNTHRICGVIDGKDNLLCLDRNLSCPITTIKFVNNSTDLNVTDNTFDLGNNITLITSHKETNFTSELENKNSIFSFFRVDSSLPCTNPIKSPSSENFFPLMKNKFDLMCDKNENGTEIVDEAFIPIDEYELENYYLDNNFYRQIHKIIDSFKIDISQNKIKIYARGYPGWSLQCVKLNPGGLSSFLLLSYELNNMLISIIIHSFISILILISIGVISCFISEYFELILKAINLGFILFNLIFPTQIISNSNFVINILTDEAGVLCGDQTLNLLLSEISQACLSLQYSFIMILFLAILSCVVYIYFLYQWIAPATREVQEQLIEMK